MQLTTGNSKNIPYLIGLVCIALALLVGLQLAWLGQSRQLLLEQFDQKAEMAIGKTLSDFNSKYQTNLEISNVKTCNDSDQCICIDIKDEVLTSISLPKLCSDLNCSLSCFGMGNQYSLDLTDNAANQSLAIESFDCSQVDLAAAAFPNTFTLGVNFPTKNQYLIKHMRFMVLSMIAVFLLMAFVLFWILRSLIHQKQITNNNIDFFNNTAHELKTPLTNISLALKLLGRRYDFIQDDAYVEIMDKETSKLKDHVDRVLYLSKMEMGQYQLNKKPISIKNVLNEVIADLKMVLDEKEGRIVLDMTSADFVVEGDYYHLGNVFKNLIDNSIKYSEKKPIIHISVIENQEGVKINFKDNGIGISKADQEHIFKKFQRVNTGDVRNSKGFGIGLSYVKTVIDMHRGMIKVLSEINQGSQFELFIPIK